MDAIKSIVKLVKIGRFRKEQIKMFCDYVERSAIIISNSVDPVHLKRRAERLAEINAAHTDKELSEMNECFKVLILEIKEKALSQRFEDILGRAFEECGLCDKGQDFSFPDVARLLGNIGFRNNDKLPEKGYFDFYEGACGSGALVLSAAEVLYKDGIDYTRKLVAYANDIDRMCVHMAYIQISLHGIPAVIALGNTITEQEFERWYTPVYIMGKWVMRRPFKGNVSDDFALKCSTVPYYSAIQSLLVLEKPNEGDAKK